MTALLWLGVFPLWQRGSYTHITGDKWLGMLVITALSVFFRCEDLIGKKKRGERLLPADERDVEKHIPQILCALYFLWVVFSALFGAANSQRNESGQLAVLIGAVRYEGLLTQLCYFLIFLCMSAEKVSSRQCEASAAVAMLIYLAVVFAQYAGANPFGLYPAGLSIRTNPAFQGTIGNVDLVSGYAVLITGFLSAVFLSAREGAWLAFAGATAGVALSVCMGVQSGLLALTTGAALALYHMAGHPEVRFRTWLVLSAAALCAFVRSMILFPWGTDHRHLHRLPSAENSLPSYYCLLWLRSWRSSASAVPAVL